MTNKSNTAFLLHVCLVAALGGLLFGYDTAVISGAIGFLQTHFALSPAMKGWAASSALLGCALGVSVAGIVSDRTGRKMAQIVAGVCFFVSAAGTALAGSLSIFVVFRVLGGAGVGIASMVAPMYIAEISPARVRGRLVSVNQLAIVSGILIVYFVNYFIAQAGDTAWNTTTGWRWMFASGAVPATLLLGLLLTVPESPRWLIEHGRTAKAQEVLTRVGGRPFAVAEVQAIANAVALEKQERLGLFTVQTRRALALGISLAVLQQVTGINVFLYYAPEIFKQMGAGANAALLETIIVGAVNLAFTLIAIGTVDRLGRKPLMIVGAAGMGIALVSLGAAAQFHCVATWAVIPILGYIACFALSVGPVTWVILTEIFANRIRARAMSLATLALWTANFVVSQTFPVMDENTWLVERFHHGLPFYVYGAFCVVLVVLVCLAVPETKGRSLEEIETYWSRQG